jgi:predicted TPR repeat methyltransferase
VSERKAIDQKAHAFFDDLWKRGDPWDLESSEFEQGKYMRQREMLGGRRYARALEIGCGAGWFTRFLAHIAQNVVALDVAASAIARARAAGGDPDVVDFRVANVMDYDLRSEGPWDLVVMSETIYYLGWLYPFFDVAWLASELFASTTIGGRLLMANTCGGVEEDYLLRPWLIHTYRDMFLNVGYRLETEETFWGTKNGAGLEVLISLFIKVPEGATAVEGSVAVTTSNEEQRAW